MGNGSIIMVIWRKITIYFLKSDGKRLLSSSVLLDLESGVKVYRTYVIVANFIINCSIITTLVNAVF